MTYSDTIDISSFSGRPQRHHGRVHRTGVAEWEIGAERSAVQCGAVRCRHSSGRIMIMIRVGKAEPLRGVAIWRNRLLGRQVMQNWSAGKQTIRARVREKMS